LLPFSDHLLFSTLLGIDIDPDAIEFSRRSLQPFIAEGRVELTKANFLQLPTLLGSRKVDLLFLDLGLSYLQISKPERGFTLKSETLDMRSLHHVKRRVDEVSQDVPGRPLPPRLFSAME